MSILPQAAQPLLHAFAGAFTRPTFKRFLTLMLGAVLTTGRRTITNLLRAVRGLAPGHPSSYSGSPLGCAQATGLEPAQDVLRTHRPQRRTHRVGDRLRRPRRRRPQPSLDLREHLLDRRQVGAVWRQRHQARPGPLDRMTRPGP